MYRSASSEPSPKTISLVSKRTQSPRDKKRSATTTGRTPNHPDLSFFSYAYFTDILTIVDSCTTFFRQRCYVALLKHFRGPGIYLNMAHRNTKKSPGFFEKIAVSIAASAVLLGTSAFAQGAQNEDQSLDSAANDPTASIMSFQLQDFFTSDIHNSNATSNSVQFRAAIPFRLWDLNHIARLTLPYATETASGATGLGDATLFDLVTFNRSWGRFGVGAVALLPTGANGISAEKWAVGPAAGFVAQRPWGLLGAFNQNLFSFAGDDSRPDVALSTLQPILSIPLNDGWSVGVSEMTFVYDWDQGEFTSIPLGAKVAKMTKIGGRPVQWSLSYERNFYDTGTGPKDTVGLTAKLLVPR